MRVGIFTDTFTPQINGVTSVVSDLERAFLRQGHQIYIFAPAYFRAQRHQNGHIFRFPAIQARFHKESRIVIPYDRRAFSVFSELEAVYSHTPFSMGLLALRVARKYKLPHIHTYHTLFTEYLHYLPRLIRPSRQMTERLSAAFCNRCDAITVPSEAMREELLRYGVRKPIYVLPFGVDMQLYERSPKRDVRQKLGLTPHELFLLYAGRLGPEKNLDFLLQSFRALLDRWTGERPLRLVLAGDGAYRARLEELAQRLRLGDRVIFAGFIPREELIDYYRSADLFVFASKTETQGLVLIEAMAAGLPAVAVRAMGVQDVVFPGETGALVSEAEFVEAILALLQDEQERQRLRAGAKRKAHEMSIDRCAQRLIEIFQQLAALTPATL
ncbi:MAG: glycosyltransferase family 4 protein [Candidatus Bipolaricaulota bacterium]|nr:glycosyltransferase family 4 protein [Candidatus Bipolaricaulota bacterium]MCS7274794.1 glycosyltransferase family 4 protein [Candidatus Bipolaricaulota bacterium]MDW8110071.1 glycosyltransferase family 4 protein [Candidatus Bipolaricaulota bacterium]MDW8329606.1 glycosyltransferase family 4 protein [Candidatus Bipolaricaulota bacterium]